jgi:DNA-binding transcriptional LysR family regulator
MRSADLAGIEVFVAVAELRSFRAAGALLGVTGSAVSQTVRLLEDRLGVALLQRTTRSVAMTEAGERLYQGVKPALATLTASVESLEEMRRTPAGTLRLTVSSIAESFLNESVIADFLAECPEVCLDVVVDDGATDIVGEGYDAGIRLGEVVVEDMVAIPVSPDQRQVVVGAPAYLAEHGKPKHPRDLHTHACIGWRHISASTPYRWEFSDNGKDFEVNIEARVNTTDMGLMIRLALAGVGLTIGLESTFSAYLRRKELISVLEPYCEPFPGFFLYYPKRPQTPLKLKAMADFLRRRSRGHHPGRARS